MILRSEHQECFPGTWRSRAQWKGLAQRVRAKQVRRLLAECGFVRSQQISALGARWWGASSMQAVSEVDQDFVPRPFWQESLDCNAKDTPRRPVGRSSLSGAGLQIAPLFGHSAHCVVELAVVPAPGCDQDTSLGQSRKPAVLQTLVREASLRPRSPSKADSANFPVALLMGAPHWWREVMQKSMVIIYHRRISHPCWDPSYPLQWLRN